MVELPAPWPPISHQRISAYRLGEWEVSSHSPHATPNWSIHKVLNVVDIAFF